MRYQCIRYSGGYELIDTHTDRCFTLKGEALVYFKQAEPACTFRWQQFVGALFVKDRWF